jgi:hypothetical protein
VPASRDDPRPTPVAEPALRATEQWLTARGLPMLVEGQPTGAAVWTRALPALLISFVLLLVAAVQGVDLQLSASRDDAPVVLDLEAPGPQALLGTVVVLALLVVALAVTHRLGHRHDALTAPRTVVWWVLPVYLLVPTAASLLLGDDWAEALVVLAAAAALLVVIFLVTRYALLALLCWGVRWTFGQLGDVYRLATRALPLMLLFITFLFVNTEAWQVAGTMNTGVLWAALAVFAGLGVLFLAGRVRDEVDGLDLTVDRPAVLAAVRDTPLADVAAELPDLDRPVPLGRAQRTNVGLVLVSAQLVQAALIAAVVWAFFVAFGALAISVQVQQAWLGGLGGVDVVVPLGERHAVTRPLLRVCTFIGGFAGFYAMVYAASDQLYRAHFFDGIAGQIANALAVRRVYLAVRRAAGLPAPGPVLAADAGVAPAAPSG